MAKRKRLAPSISLSTENTEQDNNYHRSYRAAPIATVTGDASAAAAMDEMADTLQHARENGRMLLSLPLDSIQSDYLVRDRISADSEGMQALKQSLRHRGQQVPIEVVALGSDQYGLISGWRRLQALRELQQVEGGNGKFDRILALLRSPDQSADAYLAMVEENEIRVGLSYYERARIASKATRSGVFETEKSALQELYHAVSRAKRSKIKSFIRIVEELEGHLKFPEAISERLGLALSKALETDEMLKKRLVKQLRAAQISDAGSELVLLQDEIRNSKSAKTRITDSKLVADAHVASQIELRPGLYMLTNSDGSVTLKGAVMNADLRARILDWLSER